MIPGLHQLRGYELRTRLGDARGVTLFLARQNVSGRDVGVQLLAADLVRLPGFVQRLAAVAEQVAPLRHPRVVATDEVVLGDQVAAVVTEAVVAVPLAELLTPDQPLPLATAMVVVDDVLRAVGAAHAAQVVHCGIVPERVVVQADGEVRLDGFAMARALALTGGDLGAPVQGYSSPERLGGVLPDGVNDLYATAALAHRLLAGSTPTPGTAAPITALPALTTVLSHALAADPQRRYPSAAALRNALTGTVVELLGTDWRSGSDLAERAGTRLREIGAIPAPPPVAPPAPVAPPPPPVSPVPWSAETQPAGSSGVGPAPPPPSADRGHRPSPAEPAYRGRTLAPPPPPPPARRGRLVLLVVLVLLIGGAAIAAVVLRGRGGGSAPGSASSTAAAPLGVGGNLSVDVKRTDQGSCVVDFVATASGSLTGSGRLTYHWEQTGSPPTPEQSIDITNQVGLGIVQIFRYQGHQTGTAVLTFVVTAPQQRSASKTIDLVTC